MSEIATGAWDAPVMGEIKRLQSSVDIEKRLRKDAEERAESIIARLQRLHDAVVADRDDLARQIGEQAAEVDRLATERGNLVWLLSHEYQAANPDAPEPDWCVLAGAQREAAGGSDG